MGNKGSKDKKVEKQKPQQQIQSLDEKISAVQKEMQEEFGQETEWQSNPLLKQRRNSLQGQMDGLQRLRRSTVVLQKAKGNDEIQKAQKKQHDEWAEYQKQQEMQQQMQQQKPMHNYNQRPQYEAPKPLLPLFQKQEPPQQLKALDKQIDQWQSDGVHHNSLEQLKRVRKSTVVIMDEQDDQKRKEAQNERDLVFDQVMEANLRAYAYYAKLKREKDAQNQNHNQQNVKPQPIVNLAKACGMVKRPVPTPLDADNIEQFSAFANAGLLVRIANGLGHGSCTATLLQDGQTLVTAGHCVGLLKEEEEQKEKIKRFKVNSGANALRWCPMYSKKSQGGVAQEDLFYCPLVREMYVFKAWRETADDTKTKNNRGFLAYDIGVLKLNKHIDDFQIEMAKSGKSWKKQYGFVIGGLPFNYIQTKEIDQMVDSPHKIIVEQKQDVETSPQKDLNGHAVEAQPLFGEANAYTAQLAVAGYPVDSNNQLYLYMWTVNVDPRDKHNKYPMCMYSLANRKNNPSKDTRITFPIKTNHGASGSSLIHLTGNGAGYVIGVLSAGNRVQGKERTAFRLFDLHAVRMITAVQQGYDSILSYNTNEKDVNYKIVGWEAIEPQLGEFKGWAALDMAGTVSNARAMDGAFDNYYDSVAMDGGYRTFNGYNDGYANLHTAILLFILVVFCCVMCMVSTACFGVGCFIFGHKVSSKSQAKPITASSEDEV
eukprot:315701_1